MLLKDYSCYFKLILSLTCFVSATINATACPNAPVAISNQSGSLLKDQAQVAMDNAGNAIAIWREVDLNNPNEVFIQTSNYTPGLGWSPVVTIVTLPSSISVASPQIAISRATGNAVATWAQTDSGTSESFIFSSQRPFNTGVWGSPIQVSNNHISPNDFQVYLPSLAINDSGYAVVVWNRFDFLTSTNYLASAELQFGAGAWTNLILVAGNTNTLSYQKVSVDPAGTAYAIWNNESSGVVQAATLAMNGVAWSSATNLSGAINQYLPVNLQAGGTGFAAAAWIAFDSINAVVQTAIFESGGWSANETLSGNLALNYLTFPGIAVDSNNNASVLWNDSVLSTTLIESRYRPSLTGVWDPIVTVSSSANDILAFPEVSFGDVQDAYAVWISGTSPNFENPHVEYSYASAGGSWAAPACDQVFSFGAANTPFIPMNHIAVAPNGDGVIVWEDDNKVVVQAADFPAAIPVVISITPSEGSAGGGNTVVITGTDFIQVTGIEFGLGNFSPSFTVISSTLILAVVPPGIVGTTVDVTVTNPGGTSAITPSDQYTYTTVNCYQR